METNLYSILRSVPIEYLMFGAAVLILTSVISSKLSSRLGVPALLLFLLVGMLLGSDGPGGIYFDDPWLSQLMGSTALAIILYNGGMSTDWKYVKPVLRPAVALATVGVLLTAVLMGVFTKLVLNLSWLEAMLLGSVISSTDAAAVFSVLRSRNAALKGKLAPLLELESGLNDPMAVFLTIGFVQLVTNPQATLLDMLPLFATQMIFGVIAGLLFGWITVHLINIIKLEYDAMYPVLLMALVILAYAGTAAIRGSGFLAIYVMGIYVGNSKVIHRRSLSRFSDALAWLMQILMFLTLGLLVFPSRLLGVAGSGLALSLLLMFVARPVATMVTLAFNKMNFREKTMVSWVGLKAAVPIVLATIPLLAGVGEAQTIFNVVFFVVITSALVQGTSIPLVAGWLGLRAKAPSNTPSPIELNADNTNNSLVQIRVEPQSHAAGREIVKLGMPPETLIVLVERNNQYIVPTGNTKLLADDRLMLLGNSELMDEARRVLATPRRDEIQ